MEDLFSVSNLNNTTHSGWRSRGYLPHYDSAGVVQFVTFRLFDSMPQERRAEWEHLILADADLRNNPKRMQAIDNYLDAGYGSCMLRDERVARIMEDTLLKFDGERYRLLAWVVMPNHVHVLIEVMDGAKCSLEAVMHSWKSYTASAGNQILCRKGQFWQKEYFDRYIRDDRHFANVRAYIDNNPVAAGLARCPNEWLYCSAHHSTTSDSQ